MAIETKIDRVQVIGALETVWRSIAALGATLDEDDWRRPSRLPGWTTKDLVSHIIGTESLLAGRPQPQAEAGDAPHVRNDIGKLNEAWVEERRQRTGGEVLEEFVSVTDQRLTTLGRMSQQQFDEEAWTPAGLATYGRFMQIRVFDCWMHELDLRDALGRPGDLEGPAVEVSMSEIGTGLGYAVGKKAAVPSGSTVAIVVTGPRKRRFDVVVTDRARLSDQPVLNPTTTVTCHVETFAALVGGRVDPTPLIDGGAVGVAGDVALGRRVASNLAFVI
jgi:uncharacterized protein (TIGR03083 family)